MQYAYPPRPSHPRRRPSKKISVLVGLVLLIGIVAAFALTTRSSDVPAPKAAVKPAVKTSVPDQSSINFIATGDWIAHDSVNAAAKQADGSYDYLPMVSDFRALFKKSDIRFCNDPILNGGQSLGITGYPKFNSPTDFVDDMGSFGCNLVNTASNHSFDFTQANISNSVEAWSKVPNTLAVAGQNRSEEEHDAVHYFTIKGVKFAFLAYTAYINTDAPIQNSYGVNVFSKEFAASQIAAAKQNGAQFIVTSMRWGTEYSTVVNAEQKSIAQFLADQGVNLVLGHGSHELQTVSQVTGSSGTKTLVWYSLGNFLNTQESPETLFNGLASLQINTQTLAISDIKYLPIYMHYEWTPAQAAADNTNARTALHLYRIEEATQAMIDAQQLKTTVAAQRIRIHNTLNANGLSIPLVTATQL
ncbi:CapA family protein [Aeromicrobium sp.]|nr:CapA family protein [Candidatus Saccharibacteria bacterium]